MQYGIIFRHIALASESNGRGPPTQHAVVPIDDDIRSPFSRLPEVQWTEVMKFGDRELPIVGDIVFGAHSQDSSENREAFSDGVFKESGADPSVSS
jgi:hypothetical protein